jgi:hypothetical protein
VQGKKPRWDAANYTLWWGRRVVKRYTGMAPAQVAILAAFEEAAWTTSLPVSQLRAQARERKQWLRDTVKNLNRSVRPYLHFCQERSGTYLRWSLAQRRARGQTAAT